jgi:hypothetical protein
MLKDSIIRAREWLQEAEALQVQNNTTGFHTDVIETMLPG